MTVLISALNTLKKRIEKVFSYPASESIKTISVDIAPALDFELLDWFDIINLYPKYYWHSRDNKTQMCAFGEAVHFTHLSQAKEYIEHGQKILGIQYFNDRAMHEANQHFFIPRLLLLKEEGMWKFIANVSDDAQELIDIIGTIPTQAHAPNLAPCIINEPLHEPDMEQWEEMIDEATLSIKAKQLQKVVLARKTTVTFESPLHASALLKASIERNRNHYHFMFVLNTNKAFVGSSPERLYQREDRSLKTEALAGTVKRGASKEQDQQLGHWLLNDAKNLDENEIVVNDIKRSLATMTDSFVVNDECELVKLTHVQHLKKRIDATLSANVLDMEIVQRLQPTAAIAGMPRNKALRFIADFEPFPRKWYAGAMGFIEKDRSEFCVTLRSLLIEGHNAHFYVGAGIMGESEAKTEWQELNHKLSSMMQLVSQYPLSRRSNE